MKLKKTIIPEQITDAIIINDYICLNHGRLDLIIDTFDADNNKISEKIIRLNPDEIPANLNGALNSLKNQVKNYLRTLPEYLDAEELPEELTEE